MLLFSCKNFIFNYISLLFHQCILWILLIIIMKGMIINECVKAFTLRMNIWEKLKL
ncbi:hypothetical protein SS52_4003 [Escherichia coli O157:H7 str. SS52]|nr:hypothetical protein ECH74115_4127 [Escherichia coli O157:H7 str. EC4115]ACT73557.1 hypothetical protein ECSP_3810 [Escherichia coli O157:H7 str. TW14359]AIF95379.1 hypothetical protein SS17_3849 [Escherichia coli O157:H7 str. SS17]AJA27825.1 hypothetical protein SS52_4003 [Escherichia coli O157:H7 str. SS52]EDU32647.1 hypothetical protein ECH7EC4196_3152 [Escherichia coli O157:H7 str. EC4196]EDU55880.1 hypothetical protein ECH7EC4113_1424 [Escherichia coli O157:H7 str. EC4113]EDU72238.1 h